MSELKLVRPRRVYKPLANGEEASTLCRRSAGLCESFWWTCARRFNLLVLKTPPSGAQPLAAALDAEKFKEVAGTIAGDDTVLVITPSRQARAAVQKRNGGSAPMSDPHGSP